MGDSSTSSTWWCEGEVVVELPLPLGEEEATTTTTTFDLEKAVCSHGMFMMSPNHWDPLTKTLLRPLRISDSDDIDDHKSSSSVLVRISHPQPAHSLLLHVFGTRPLSPRHQQQLIAQVRRMLRLSEADERNVKEFQKKMHTCSGGRGEQEQEQEQQGCNFNFNVNVISRVFRSPTLFEDMVKCILLCNCQWPRTLSMAKALCDLQLELQCPSSGLSVTEVEDTKLKGAEAEIDHLIIPKTPARKESQKKFGVPKVSVNLTENFSKTNKADGNLMMDRLGPNFFSDGLLEEFNSGHSASEPYAHYKMGNFPSPSELATLDEGFLAKRCKLGYRARRILKLAQSIVDGKIQLKQLEQVCNDGSLASYEILNTQLKDIEGFGSFTCANVLMCMGFYHVIPSDSETVRHLYQVHSRKSTVKTVQRDVEGIYQKYAPFQFLAYWSEVWHFYEKRFGKLSEMPRSDYKLITASNMRCEGTSKPKTKRTKTS